MGKDRAVYEREWRKKNPDALRRYKNEYQRKYIQRRADLLEKYLDGKSCVRCGFGDYRALEFHHRDPSQKRWTIGFGIRRYNWEKVEEEIAKCDLLCANCHRIEHGRWRVPPMPEE